MQNIEFRIKNRGISLWIVLAALSILALLAIFYILYSEHFRAQSATASPAATTTPYVVPALTQPYSNSNYKFSLKMPADFTASESKNPDGSSDTIVLQNSAGDGIQIVISPWDEDKPPYSGYTLTAARIQQDLPELAISDVQPVTVGPNYTGVAFKSDNEAFDGASREVWFVFRGNLYQISTYQRLDDLLKEMFATWQFQ